MSQPQDAFPDLHHRMSKKIAQLTKVIYHLNTKNDVHELEMKGVQQLYESEIDEIVRDAQTKLQAFMTRLNDTNQTQVIEQLKKQLLEERERSKVEMQKMERTCSEQVETVTGACKVKLESMTVDLIHAKSAFEQKVSQLQTQWRDKEKEMALRVSEWQTKCTELQRKHEVEIADAVKSSNLKYMEMMRERMQKEDELNEQLKLKHDESERLKHSVSELQTSVETHKTNASKYQSRVTELETLLKGKDSETAKQIGKLLQDLESLRSSEALREKLHAEKLAEKDKIIAELQSSTDSSSAKWIEQAKQAAAHIEQLQNQISKQTHEIATLKSQLSAAAEALASSQAESQSISRTLAARDDELKRNVDELKTTLQAKDFLAKVLLDRQNQIKEMESQDEKQKREVRELKLELDKLKGRLENSASGAAAEIETLSKQVKALTTDRDAARADLAKLREDNRTAIEREALQLEKLKAAQAATEAAQAATESAKAEARKEARAAADAMEAQRIAAAEKLKQELEQQTLSHAHALKKAQQQASDLQIQIDEQKRVLEKSKSETERKVREIEAKHQVALDAAAAENKKLAATIAELQSKIQSLEKTIEGEKQKTEAANLKIKETEKAKTEVETRLAALEAQLKASQAQLTQVANEHAAALAAQQAIVEKVQAEFDSHRAETDKRIAAEQSRLADARLERDRLIREHDEQTRHALEAHRVELEQTQQRHQHSLTELQELAHANAQRDCERAERELEAAVRRTADQASEERKKLQLDHQDAMQRADAEHVARAAAAAELALKQHQHALSSLQSQHSQALQVLQQQHDESSQRERREADERIRAKEVQIQEHERQLYDLSQESKRKDEANEQEKHTLAREMQRRELDLQRMAKEDARITAQRFNEQIQILKEESERDLDAARAAQAALQSQLAEAQQRYANRESRAEDLALITQFKQLIMQQAEMVQKQEAELKFFKLELMNREENFNRRFNNDSKLVNNNSGFAGGANMNVGVMNVVKQAGSSTLVPMQAVVAAAAQGIAPTTVQQSLTYGQANSGGSSRRLVPPLQTQSSAPAPSATTASNPTPTGNVTPSSRPRSAVRESIGAAGVRGLMELRDRGQDVGNAIDSTSTSNNNSGRDTSSVDSSAQSSQASTARPKSGVSNSNTSRRDVDPRLSIRGSLSNLNAEQASGPSQAQLQAAVAQAWQQQSAGGSGRVASSGRV